MELMGPGGEGPSRSPPVSPAMEICRTDEIECTFSRMRALLLKLAGKSVVTKNYRSTTLFIIVRLELPYV